MRELTDQAQQAVQNLAQRYGTSADAVRTLLHAVAAGSGTMAQFSHPDLGGSGQWMQGGMTMVSDMFNHGLQAKVSGLCAELASFMAAQPVFVAAPVSAAAVQSKQSTVGSGSSLWPAELGQPSSSGGQNDSRYAIFPSTRRLAVQSAGQLRVYDTLDHQIGGVQQQQSGVGSSFTFSSQYGTFTVESLPLVHPPPAASPPPASTPPSSAQDRDEIFAALERLGNLRERGILTEDEFLTKKRELLGRL